MILLPVIFCLIVASAIAALLLYYQPPWILQMVGSLTGGMIFKFPVDTPVVALTIDDAPDPATTLKILEVLAQHQVQATFFVIGSYVEAHPAIATAIAAAGHELGNHMMADQASILLPPEAFEQRLLAAQQHIQTVLGQADRAAQPSSVEAIEAANTDSNTDAETGEVATCSEVAELREALDAVSGEASGEASGENAPHRPVWFRPGMGWYTPQMINTARQHGYQSVLGCVFPYDTAIADADWTGRFILNRVFPGAVIILHDGQQRGLRTAAVLDVVLPQLRDRGYQVTTLSALSALSASSASSAVQPQSDPH
jgi:peptidoglycan/xylan/chitin deacetylase (PgdA/CDA1 family)